MQVPLQWNNFNTYWKCYFNFSKQLSSKATENKKVEIDSTSLIAGKVEGTKKNVEKERKSEKDGNTNKNQSISKDEDDLKNTANVTKPGIDTFSYAQ